MGVKGLKVQGETPEKSLPCGFYEHRAGLYILLEPFSGKAQLTKVLMIRILRCLRFVQARCNGLGFRVGQSRFHSVSRRVHVPR